jgi:maltose O-acetyltransferase
VPSAKELMRAGEPYPGDDPALNRELDERQALVAEVNALPAVRSAERRAGLERLLAAIGEGTQIRAPFYCDWGDGIEIGARCFLNFNCTLLDGAPIRVGDECMFGPGVQLITATHPVDPAPRRAAIEQALPVTLGAGVWVGAGAIVCPGVTVGENTVVGAGAVVTRDLPAGVVAVGNPARAIRAVGAAR